MTGSFALATAAATAAGTPVDGTEATLLAIVVAGPLLAAVAVLTVRTATLRRWTALAAATVHLLAAGGLLWSVLDGATHVLAVGAHTPPLGIVLVADPLAAIATTVSAAVLLGVQVAVGGTPAERWPGTRAVLLLLGTGVTLAYVTADLFTLFVAFEVVLFASYALLTRDGGRAGVREAGGYVRTNLVASGVFVLGIAGVYGVTGHVNLAAVADVWPTVPAAVRTLLLTTLLGAFAVKAALVPVGAWLPRTYAVLPPVIGAAAAALLTKVGVVAMLRVATLLDIDRATTGVLMGVAVATMLGGVVVALGETSLHRVLSAHVISQVGFLIVGIALLDVAGVAASMLYLGHHVLVKAALLLVAAGIVARTGTLELGALRGIQRSAPLLAVLFLVAAAALAGLPPTSGFVAKLALLRAGVDAGAWIAVAGMLLASALTLVSMAKVHQALLGTADEPTGTSSGPSPAAVAATHGGTTTVADDRDVAVTGGGAVAVSGRAERGATLAAAGLLVLALVGTVFAGPLHELTLVAAERLLDPATFVRTVLP